MLAAKCQSLRHKMNNFLNIFMSLKQNTVEAISSENHDGMNKKKLNTLYGNYSKLVESSPFLFNFMFIIVFCVCLLFTDMQNNFFIG